MKLFKWWYHNVQIRYRLLKCCYYGNTADIYYYTTIPLLRGLDGRGHFRQFLICCRKELYIKVYKDAEIQKMIYRDFSIAKE